MTAKTNTTARKTTSARKAAPRKATADAPPDTNAPVATDPGCSHPECTLDHPHPGPAILAGAPPASAPEDGQEAPPAEPAPAAVTGSEKCAVPDCPRKPTTHAVCDAHWATHRGYATKE